MRLSADASREKIMELDYDSLYVGGEWITPASSSKVTVVSAPSHHLNFTVADILGKVQERIAQG